VSVDTTIDLLHIARNGANRLTIADFHDVGVVGV
jgi:hypothetical protein